jgi:hypothetical protein
MQPSRKERLLRQALWVTSLHRCIAHEVSVRENRAALNLRAEVERVMERSRLLRRRSRWLLQTGRPLPRVVGK